MGKSLLVVILVILGAVIAITGAGLYEDEVTVQTVRVGREEIASVIPATGTVASRVEVELSAPVAGQVATVAADEGDRVAQGQVLVTLDDQEANALKEKARAVLEWRRLQLDLASQTYQRLKETAAAGGVSRQTLDSARADRDIAHMQMNVAAAELQLMEVRSERLRIRSPVSGVVATKDVKVGEWTGRIAAQDIFNPKAMFTVVDPDQLFLLTRIDTADVGNLQMGQEVIVESVLYPDTQWNEQVIWIAPTVTEESGTRLNKVHISFSNQAINLPVGSQVDLQVVVRRNQDALTLPFSAVSMLNATRHAVTIEDGRLRWQPITAGIESFSKLEVLSGLSEGQEVVLVQGRELRPGMAVTRGR